MESAFAAVMERDSNEPLAVMELSDSNEPLAFQQEPLTFDQCVTVRTRLPAAFPSNRHLWGTLPRS